MIYLLLARAVYPRLVRDTFLARVAALGTVVSFGVMSECCAIETYAPALLLDVALVAVCVNCDLATWRGGIGAGLLFALAVGLHATNVLMLPFVLVFVYRSARRRSLLAAGWLAGTVALAALLMAAGVLIGEGARLWPPELRGLIPQGDPEPAMSVPARLGRAGYGIARTLAWLPPSWELTRTYAVCFGAAVFMAGLLFLVVARRGLLQDAARYRSLWLLAAVLAGPFLILGVTYYPSDPERWLFLTPLFWLVVALAWHEYRPAAGSWLTSYRARALLVGAIVVLAAVNIGLKLWPEARSNRDLAGLKALAQIAEPGDLVIASSDKSPLVAEFVLHRPQAYDVFPLDVLMLHDHRGDMPAGQQELRDTVRRALDRGRRVVVFQLIDEDLASGRGYPWAWVANDGYTPETIIYVLHEFHPEPLQQPTAESPSIFRLSPR